MPTPRPNLIAVVHTDDGDICLDDLFEEDQLSIDIIESCAVGDNKTAGVDLTREQAQQLVAHILIWLEKLEDVIDIISVFLAVRARKDGETIPWDWVKATLKE